MINVAGTSAKAVLATNADHVALMFANNALHPLNWLHPNCSLEHALIKLALSAKLQHPCFRISAKSADLASLRDVYS